MYFKQEKSIKIENNDVYILDIVGNYILINNNYRGISIFNINLEKVKDIPIFEDLVIYSVYKDFIGEKILLYCPDNECIIYVNLELSDFNIIPLSNQDIIFSPIYYWNENLIILITYTNEFYILDIEKRVVKRIGKKEIAKSYPEFYGFWHESKGYSILKIYSQELKFVFNDTDHDRIGLLKFKQNNKFFIEKPNNIGHDVEYKDKKFMFIKENKIILLSEKKLITWDANKNEIFLRARFLNTNTIIILSSMKDDFKNNTITKCKIM